MNNPLRACAAPVSGTRRSAFAFVKPLLLGLCVLGVASCKDPEERAEEYYASAVSLVEAEDTDRALVELRNVFDHDGTHKQARRLYADLLRERGRTGDAYSHYLRLIEQYPDTVEVRRILAELALQRGDWQEVRRHGEAAVELAPEAPESRAIEAALAYREAERAGDAPAQAEAAETARELVEQDPDLMIARRILIDWLVQSPEPSRALPHLDAAIERDPESRQLRMARLAVLDRTGQTEALGAELKEMYEIFPEDETISDYLISWYLRTGDAEGAESFLRDKAGPKDGAPEAHLSVVSLLRREEGTEAALAELQELETANEGTDLGRLYATRAAELRFDDGDREAAVARMEEIVAAAEGPERRIDAKVTLAEMRMAQGEREAALTLAGEVLEQDSRRVEALKMRAGQRLREGEAGAAVNDLRLALDQEPQDPEILTMLAEAQRASGNTELAQQRMADAVEASGNGVSESLAYARYLVEQEQLSTAESVLQTAAEENPGALQLRQMLGEVLMRRGRYGAVRALADDLAAMESEQAQQMARSLRAVSLFRENRVDESLALLEQQAGDSNGGEGGQEDLSSSMQLLDLQVRSKRFEAAQETLDGLAERYPDSRWVEVVEGDIQATRGRLDEASETYAAILEDHPEALPVIERQLRVLNEQGRGEKAAALLQSSLERLPEARPLRLREAARRQQAEDYDGAIEIYGALYEEDPRDIVAANNLASARSLHGDGEGDLDRAYEVAQQFAGSDRPPLLDTLGWVQLQRGEVDAAIRNFEAAARGLPDNPTVAFDLGMAYAEAGRTDRAREEIERGLELAGDRDVPQRERAQETLGELQG